MPRRIAMWSGPRNISTAMLRAWENRPDTVVVDEPFYAHYLAATGLDHPGRYAVLASQATQPAEVIAQLLTIPEASAGIFYQKHMCQHMLENIPLDWMAKIDHVFLIRAPQPVVASFSKVRTAPTLSELGFRRQAELFDAVCDYQGEAPAVIEASDVLRAPESMLRTLCMRLNIGFTTRMLSWPAGPRDSDGVWAPYWYGAVQASTGFQSPVTRHPVLNRQQRRLADACQPYYDRLYKLRLH